MRHLVWFFWLLSSPCFASTPISGLERPLVEMKTELELDKSVEPPLPAVRKCYVYNDFAVVEINKPSLKGAEKIEVRPRKGETDPKNLCDEIFRGPKFELQSSEGYFLGAIRQYLIVNCADTHGGGCYAEIFDAKNGHKIADESYQTLSDAKLRAVGESVEWTFSRILTQNSREICLPEKDRRCWNEILKENKVPKTVNIAAPDCSKVFKGDPELRQQFSSMFSAPAKLTLPADKESRWLTGKARCWLSP